MQQGKYTYRVIKDHDRNIIGILVRYGNNDAIVIPFIDIILQLEKIV